MILDTLSRCEPYRKLHARLAAGFDFLREADVANLPVGRHEIDGENLFAIVDQYTTKPAEQCKLEAHRRYHDIQYMVRGVEYMGYAPLETVTVREAYDPHRDVAFFTGSYTPLKVEAGMFVVFAPHDAHAPQIAAPHPAAIRKIVVKVDLRE